MGAKACKKSKVRQPKRDAAKELEEKERAEKEAQEKAEAEAEALREAQAEAARLAAEKEKEAEEARKRAEEAEAQRLAEEARLKAEAEAAEEEARRKAEQEEAEARMKAAEEEAVARRKAEEEAAAAAAAGPMSLRAVSPTAQSPKEQPASPRQAALPSTAPEEPVLALPSTAPPPEIKDDAASEATMSTQATGAVHKTPKGKVSEMAQGATPRTTRSIGNCDMTPIDKTAKNIAKMCGCDLGDDHDENKCPICKNMDLSDAPILN